jgi:hypothetical protein
MPIPLIVALGRSVPLNRNIEAQQINHGFNEADLKIAPWAKTTPRLFFPANGARKTITLYVPVDGKGVYVGGDSSLTKETGAELSPGQAFRLFAYYGPLWVIAESGLQQVFAVET